MPTCDSGALSGWELEFQCRLNGTLGFKEIPEVLSFLPYLGQDPQI